MASKQQQAFKMCVHPCPRYLTGGDTHTLCVACLGEEHAQSVLESAGCEHCNMLPLRTLRSRLAFFREDAQARVPQGSDPAAAEAQRRLRSWGMGCVSCQGLPTKANSRVLFTSEKGYVATPDA